MRGQPQHRDHEDDHRDEDHGLTGASALLNERRLAALVGHRGAGFDYLDAQLKHRLVDGAAHGQITTAAPGREARQARQQQASRKAGSGAIRFAEVMPSAVPA